MVTKNTNKPGKGRIKDERNKNVTNFNTLKVLHSQLACTNKSVRWAGYKKPDLPFNLILVQAF